MSRAGWAIRQGQRLDAAAARKCTECGHAMGVHRELQYATFEVVDGEVVEVPNEAYKPGEFHCSADGCECVMDAFASRA